MKKFSCIFILLVAVGLQNISAQVPGYQGKRFSVGYNASSFFYFKQVENSDGLVDYLNEALSTTTISYKTELAVNYAISRKVVMGLSYYFAKQNISFVNNEIGNNYEIPVDDIAKCKLSIYELHFQFFRKNFIAPAGLYHQVSVGIVKYGLATSDNKLTVYGQHQSNPMVINGPTDPYTCFKLGYSIGKTNPIGHNFYINTAFGINFFRGGDSAYVKTTPTAQNYILANFNRGLRVHNFAEIKIGFGWLAF
jgi:hypothetical protein